MRCFDVQLSMRFGVAFLDCCCACWDSLHGLIGSVLER